MTEKAGERQTDLQSTLAPLKKAELRHFCACKQQEGGGGHPPVNYIKLYHYGAQKRLLTSNKFVYGPVRFLFLQQNCECWIIIIYGIETRWSEYVGNKTHCMTQFDLHIFYRQLTISLRDLPAKF